MDSIERPSAAAIYSKAMFSRNDENLSDVFTSAKNQLIELMEHEPTDLACLSQFFFMSTS